MGNDAAASLPSSYNNNNEQDLDLQEHTGSPAEGETPFVSGEERGLVSLHVVEALLSLPQGGARWHSFGHSLCCEAPMLCVDVVIVVVIVVVVDDVDDVVHGRCQS